MAKGLNESGRGGGWGSASSTNIKSLTEQCQTQGRTLRGWMTNSKTLNVRDFYLRNITHVKIPKTVCVSMNIDREVIVCFIEVMGFLTGYVGEILSVED